VLFCPHPPPLSHLVGEGCRGAARRPPASGGSSASALHIPLARLWERGARGVRAKRKMRPEESGRTLLDFTEVGGVELHTPATDCRA